MFSFSHCHAVFHKLIYILKAASLLCPVAIVTSIVPVHTPSARVPLLRGAADSGAGFTLFSCFIANITHNNLTDRVGQQNVLNVLHLDF